ncbi:MAG: hypothetical protein NVSMB24_39980 [Mucilaginibacter sp.]
MGQLIRSFDWTTNPLGSPSDWPIALKQSVSMMLHNKFPVLICWGPEYIQLYNDAFRPINGETKHPSALGGSARDTYAEIWDTIGPMFGEVMTGHAHGFPNFKVPLNRNGYPEDCYFDFSYSPIADLEGHIQGVLVICVETTDKIRSIQEYKESEDRFRTMAEDSDILIAVADESSNAVYFSKSWVELTGRSMEDLLAFGWADLVHPEDRERYVNIYLSAFEKRVPFTGEFRVLSKNGDYRWLLAKGPPRFRPDGSFAGYISSCTDITERKSNEQQLQLLINMLPVSVVVIRGPDLIVEMINQANLGYWNKTAAEVIGKPFLDILPDLADQPFAGQLRQVMATGEMIDVKESPVLFENPDGSIRETFVDYTYQPLTDISGKHTGVLVMSFEITDRVKARILLQEYADEMQALNEELAASNEELATANAELVQIQNLLEKETEQRAAAIERLKISEQQSRSIVAAAPFPIGVYTGREMRILMANQTIMDVWGKGNDVIGKTYHEILPELSNQDIYQQLDNVFITGEPFHARNQRVDIVVGGRLQPFYFNYSFTPLRDPDGQVYGVMNTAAELTDLVLAKQQVEQSEQNLKAMIAQAPVAMCILSGPEHVVTVANQLMVELWGKPEADVMNKAIFDALPDARGQGLEEVMKDVYETGETFYASELPVSLIRHGRPEVVYQNFVYQAYRDGTGRIAGVMAITIDVTEQVLARKTIEQSEADLRDIKKQLEAELETSKQVQRQKDGFIGMASHELKTPLTSLNAIIQVANAKLKQSNDSFLVGAMEKANQQVKRMTAMINGFLNVSRLESGRIHIEKQVFDIGTLLSEAVDEARLIFNTHNIHLPNCPAIRVNADREKIGSVISNLISNAVKYSPKGKNVGIDCVVQSNEVIISVNDEGMGMKPHDLDKIFERYYRVETDHTRHISGFGIGLYLSSEIVRRHNGRIWAESESGKGSTFYFSLPLQ